jgi:hypothetical protein
MLVNPKKEGSVKLFQKRRHELDELINDDGFS